MHADYLCTFDPFTQNREQLIIRARIDGITHPRRRNEEHVRDEFVAHSESDVNRWALRFRHADDAVTPTAYHSLWEVLRYISFKGYQATGATIISINPATPPAPIEKAPPPAPPHRMGHKMVEEAKEKEEAIQLLNDFVKNTPLAGSADLEIILANIKQYKARIKGPDHGYY